MAREESVAEDGARSGETTREKERERVLSSNNVSVFVYNMMDALCFRLRVHHLRLRCTFLFSTSAARHVEGPVVNWRRRVDAGTREQTRHEPPAERERAGDARSAGASTRFPTGA